MTAKILELKQKEKAVPHLCGTALCLGCKHEWVAVIEKAGHHDNDGWLECPSCSLVRGKYKFEFRQRAGTEIWNCQCGNNLMEISPTHIFCPNCGRDQELPK